MCRDPNYSVHDVLSFARPYSANTSIHTKYHIQLTSYEVQKLLYKIKPSSPGLDNIPRWFFHIVHMKLLILLPIYLTRLSPVELSLVSGGKQL